MSVARRVLHLRPAIAWCGVLLSLAFAAGAGAADRIEIDIQGVDREIANNVRGFLTLARYTERDDLTDAQVRRLADRAVDEAADGLRPFGYYEPTIRSRTSRDDPRWIVRLKIQPGEPVRMDEVQVQLQGAGSNEPALLALAPASVLQPGKRLDHAAYDRLRADLLRTAIDLGYLDARLTRRELLVDPPNRKASAFLELDTGRPLQLRRGHRAAGRPRPGPAAALRALPAGHTVLQRAHPQHAVRARGQQLFLRGAHHRR